MERRLPHAWWLIPSLAFGLAFWLWAFGALAAEPEKTVNVPMTISEAQASLALYLLAQKAPNADLATAEAAVVLSKKIKAAFDAPPEVPKTEIPK